MAPGLVLLCLVFLVPVGSILILGIRNPEGQITTEYLARFLADPYYLNVAWRTIRLSLIITLMCAVAGFPLAYIMTRGSARLRLWLVIAITLPLMTSVVVRTFGWMVILGRNGLIPDALHGLGLVVRNFTLMHTETAVVIGMTQVLFPFMVLSILSVIMRIDPRLEEASRVMGCGFLTSLSRVVLPLAAPGVIAAALLVFTLSASYFIIHRIAFPASRSSAYARSSPVSRSSARPGPRWLTARAPAGPVAAQSPPSPQQPPRRPRASCPALRPGSLRPARRLRSAHPIGGTDKMTMLMAVGICQRSWTSPALKAATSTSPGAKDRTPLRYFCWKGMVRMDSRSRSP